MFVYSVCAVLHKLPKHGHILWPKHVAVVPRSVGTSHPLCCNRRKFVGSVQSGTGFDMQGNIVRCPCAALHFGP